MHSGKLQRKEIAKPQKDQAQHIQNDNYDIANTVPIITWFL